MAKHSAICESDGVMFACDKSFSIHKLLHLWETNECPICQKEFSTQCYVDQYIKDVHSEKTHACDHCDKSFFRKHDLRCHKSTVHEGRTLWCKICGGKFSRKDKLKKHYKYSKEKSDKTTDSIEIEMMKEFFFDKVETDFQDLFSTFISNEEQNVI